MNSRINKMYVIKASGKKEKFNPDKIKGTMLRAGADEKFADEIVKKVEKEIYNGITTREILDTALEILHNKKPELAALYDLKRAIMNLGPTGFPFEKFFAKILKEHGYKIKIGQTIQGKITSHEIDITAEKNSKYIIECKYHNQAGIYTGMKTALYVYARFLDLKKNFDIPWLATNTKFSNKVIKYAKGVNMKLTGWKYPEDENLQTLIHEKKLYPVTILKSVDKNIKGKLLKKGIVTIKDLIEYDFNELKSKIRIPEKILKQIIDESKKIYEVKHRNV